VADIDHNIFLCLVCWGIFLFRIGYNEKFSKTTHDISSAINFKGKKPIIQVETETAITKLKNDESNLESITFNRAALERKLGSPDLVNALENYRCCYLRDEFENIQVVELLDDAIVERMAHHLNIIWVRFAIIDAIKGSDAEKFKKLIQTLIEQNKEKYKARLRSEILERSKNPEVNKERLAKLQMEYSSLTEKIQKERKREEDQERGR